MASKKGRRKRWTKRREKPSRLKSAFGGGREGRMGVAGVRVGEDYAVRGGVGVRGGLGVEGG